MSRGLLYYRVLGTLRSRPVAVLSDAGCLPILRRVGGGGGGGGS